MNLAKKTLKNFNYNKVGGLNENTDPNLHIFNQNGDNVFAVGSDGVLVSKVVKEVDTTKIDPHKNDISILTSNGPAYFEIDKNGNMNSTNETSGSEEQGLGTTIQGEALVIEGTPIEGEASVIEGTPEKKKK